MELKARPPKFTHRSGRGAFTVSRDERVCRSAVAPVPNTVELPTSRRTGSSVFSVVAEYRALRASLYRNPESSVGTISVLKLVGWIYMTYGNQPRLSGSMNSPT